LSDFGLLIGPASWPAITDRQSPINNESTIKDHEIKHLIDWDCTIDTAGFIEAGKEVG
jgi:hypothetical protein